MSALKSFLAMHRGSTRRLPGRYGRGQSAIGRHTHKPKISRADNRPSVRRLSKLGRR